MKTEKILVLLDGIPLNNPSSTDGQAFFEHISLENIEQIEIIKGGLSSIWGSDASAGVINIITKKAKDGLHASSNISYGSYDTKSAGANLSYKKDRFDALLAISRFDNKGFSAKQPSSDEADGYFNDTVNFKTNYHLSDRNSIGFNYNYIDAEIEYDGFGGSNDPAKAFITQNDLAFSHTYQIGFYTSLLNLTKSHSNRTHSDDTTYDATQQALKWLNKVALENTNFQYGFELNTIEGSYQNAWGTDIKEKFNNDAIFANVNHRLGEIALLEAALRKDSFDTFEEQLSYKIGLKHFLHKEKQLTLGLNYYKAIDTPNAYQVANTVFGERLQPDQTKGYDISLFYQDTGITYFSNKISDRLTYDNENWGYINQQGIENINGVEIETKHHFEAINTLLTLNYTLLLKYEDDEGFALEKIAEDTLNLSLDTYITDATHFSIIGQYIGDRIEYEWNSHTIKAETGNYTLCHANFSTQIMEDIDFSLHAKNILDKTYESTYGYATEGRSIYANLKYSF
jgi:vitamin B12 transporter